MWIGGFKTTMRLKCESWVWKPQSYILKLQCLSVCPSSFQALPRQTGRHHYGVTLGARTFVFCDNYYPTDRGRASTGDGGQQGGVNTGGGGTGGKGPGERGQHEPWGGAHARKDQVGGSSTGALCTRFTLVLFNCNMVLLVGNPLDEC